MADDNIKNFSVQWVLVGLLFFSLMTFTINFFYNNNSEALGDSQDFFNQTNEEVKSKLVSIPDDSNTLLNVTAETDPEESYLGSSDSVSAGFGVTDTGKGFFESLKIFFSWIFTGTSGQILLGVFGGLLGIVLIFLIYKFIRTGS